MKLKELTKAEEEIMQILWKLESAFVKDIISEMPEPKPAYNTVSTFVRILVQKGFLDYEAFGKTHKYFPLVTKEEYRHFVTSKLKAGYFGNSAIEMMSFFVENEQINLKEADEILNLIKEMKNR